VLTLADRAIELRDNWHGVTTVIRPYRLYRPIRRGACRAVGTVTTVTKLSSIRPGSESLISPFVFVTERAAPFSPAGLAKLVERLGVKAGLGFKVHPHIRLGELRARRPWPVDGFTTGAIWDFRALSCRPVGRLERNLGERARERPLDRSAVSSPTRSYDVSDWSYCVCPGAESNYRHRDCQSP
jgi:hypothetical protein